MGGVFDPIDSLVKEILGTTRFLDNILTRTRVISGRLGTAVKVVLLLGIILFLQ
jgi:hypothetical protein